MSCHYGDISGDYSSYNGYTSDVCQQWMDTKIADLETKRDGAGKYGRIFEAQIQGFRQCTVSWEAPAEPLVDISSFERKPETGYSNTDTNADQADTYADTKADQTYTYADTKADQTDTYADTNADQTDTYADTNADQTDNSYSDDSSGVKITQETYTDDNSKIVTSVDTDNYAEDTSADIVEDKVDTSAPY